MLLIWHLVATRQDLCVDLLAPVWPGTQTTVCQIEPAGAGEMGTTRSLTPCCENVAREERFNESLLLLLSLSHTLLPGTFLKFTCKVRGEAFNISSWTLTN